MDNAKFVTSSFSKYRPMHFPHIQGVLHLVNSGSYFAKVGNPSTCKFGKTQENRFSCLLINCDRRVIRNQIAVCCPLTCFSALYEHQISFKFLRSSEKQFVSDNTLTFAVRYF